MHPCSGYGGGDSRDSTSGKDLVRDDCADFIRVYYSWYVASGVMDLSCSSFFLIACFRFSTKPSHKLANQTVELRVTTKEPLARTMGNSSERFQLYAVKQHAGKTEAEQGYPVSTYSPDRCQVSPIFHSCCGRFRRTSLPDSFFGGSESRIL